MDDRTILTSASPLAAGYQISCYTIREVLGKGGFGITYLAHDKNLDREVAIKEYLPTSFAHRHGDQSVKPITSDQGDNFAWGLANFLKEAKTLARFNHENIVRVHTVFEANDTAYMVMEYEQGDNLASIIKEQGSITQEFQRKIFYPIIEGLNKIHDLGFIHRDIKPSNIYIRANGSPVLIDFGSARQTAQQQTSEFTALISQGYTPLEQYSANYGNQGPWTDIYSMAATIYHGITGSKPDDSLGRSAFVLRSQPDRVKPLSAQDYPGYEQQFLDATHAGLSLQPELRPESLSQWLTLFKNRAPQQFDNSPTPTSVPLDDDRTRMTPVRRDPDQRDQRDQPVREQHGRHRDHTDPVINDTFSSQRTKINRENQSARARPPEKEIFGEDDFKIPPSGNRPTQTPAPTKGKTGLVVMCASLVLAATGLGIYYFLQQEKDQHTETTLSSTTAPASIPTPTPTPTPTPIASSNATPEPVAPAIAAMPEDENPQIFFDQPLATDIIVPPRSIQQLAKTSPLFPPIEGLDEAAWKEEDCSNCHSWTKESLCTQGEFYVSKDDSAITRIDHPFSGFFKSALRDWADQGCR